MLTLQTGYALRSRGALQRSDEDTATCGNCECVVGG